MLLPYVVNWRERVRNSHHITDREATIMQKPSSDDLTRETEILVRDIERAIEASREARR